MKTVTIQVDKLIYDYIVYMATIQKKSVKEVASMLLKKGYEFETYWEE